MRITATVALLVVLVLALPVGSQVSDDSLIVPGVRIGKYLLEASVADLTRLAGSEPFRLTFAGAYRIPIINAPGPYQGLIWRLEKEWRLDAYVLAGGQGLKSSSSGGHRQILPDGHTLMPVSQPGVQD
ncbi:MAG: hypothetical protein XU14_C0011G0020 [Armatimonadetes bacterium CSP1-3]|nr:MAG: hypothetical protein XU14_C0011G0020 [Armatimonadetes bacterium CSP1-3]